jgi:hypothetical protein
MSPAIVSATLLAVLAGELAIAAFIVFAIPRLAWWRRAAMAPFALVLGFGAVGIARDIANGQLDSYPAMEPGPAIGLFLLANLIGYQTVAMIRSTEASGRPSCLGTVGRMAGCVVVAWGMFALAVLGLAVLIGILVWIDQ